MEKKTYRIDGKTSLIIDKEDFLQTYKNNKVAFSVTYCQPIFNEISNKYAFSILCHGGDKDVIKCLLEILPEINCISEINYGFRLSCAHGHLDLAQWLLRTYPDINVKENNNFAFRFACYYGHLDVAKWIYNIYPDIDITENNDCDINIVSNNKHVEVMKWFCEIKPGRYEVTVDDENNKINYKVLSSSSSS